MTASNFFRLIIHCLFANGYRKLKVVMLASVRKTSITKGYMMNKPSTSLNNVANYFIAKSNEANKPITNKKLQKLVYYSQAWNLVLNDKKLFEDPIEAWIHGPAIRSLYNMYKKFYYFAITAKPTAPSFDRRTKSVLDEVWAVYGKYDADYLEILTHNEQPWLAARGDVGSNEPTARIIDTDVMKNFYAGLLKSVKA